MRVAYFHFRNAFEAAWWWFRQTTGDAAYEIYLRSAATGGHADRMDSEHPSILSREEFYLDALRRKYSGVSRCC